MRPCDLVVDRRGLARFGGRVMPCAIGRGGIRADKREGDGASPVGHWRIERVHVRADRLWLAGAAPIGPFLRWSDDPRDPAYNGPVRAPHPFGSEVMHRADPLYDIVCVLDHNRRPPVPGAGSAIFMHVWRGPRRATEGCIALARPDLRWILARWRPWSRVVIR